MQKVLFQNRTDEYDQLLTDVAEKHNVDPGLLRNLIDYERGRVHLERRPGAKKEIRQQIEEQLDDEDE
jgi:hypothetical protein